MPSDPRVLIAARILRFKVDKEYSGNSPLNARPDDTLHTLG
jgi:hypothetical protein